MPTYGYDNNTDYQALINQAVANNNFALAAIYEAQRNEKIVGEGLNYEQTNQYERYLPGSSQGQGFVNPYQQQLNEAMANLGGSFQYDPEKDENYSAYRKQYLREAERTLQDTMGQYAAMTGGIPSSQAVAAASQASDNYKAQLADKIPEMRNQAYSEWLNKQNLNMNTAQLYLGAAQQAENSYQNQISLAMSRWAQLGYADDYVSNLLGVATGTPTSDQAYQNWAMAQEEANNATRYYGGSGGGGSGSKMLDYDDELWGTLVEATADGDSATVNFWLQVLSGQGYDAEAIADALAWYVPTSLGLQEGYKGELQQ